MLRRRRHNHDAAHQAAHFDEHAHEYDESIPPHVIAHLTARRVAAVGPLERGTRVLDVGCGTGTFLRALGDGVAVLGNGIAPIGLDVSQRMLELAAANGVRAVRGSATRLPFRTASVDVVTSIAALHHLGSVDVAASAVREMARVVAPGGRLMIWDHNPLNPLWPLVMHFLPQDSGEERLVPARVVLGALREAGLTDVRVRRVTFVPIQTPRAALPVLARAEPVLEAVPGVRAFAAHNVFTARRDLS